LGTAFAFRDCVAFLLDETGRARVMAISVAALVAIAGTATGTEFDAFDRRTQVHGSDAIVTGRVLSVDADWNENHSAIFTVAEIAVDDAWKGRCADRIAVQTFGGRVGHVALEVEGAARFEAGEHVVLFLRRVGNAYSPYGMRFGKYAIVGSGPAAEVVGGLPPSRRGEHNVTTVTRPLSALRAEVASLVKEEKP
jgi:hypothetical protein